ncbi:MAG: Flp pilus assembly complex ATPase component TadA [Candidatus Nealsonbacteria bacterium]|nr:Flp pilus assembly complex ATPase component TadA [Candidatus Nealsonbacteria bacterium]
MRPEIKYDFATGLRHILRQDPNVIMVGEIRDEETAGLAINAALTGHIVLSTLHTSNAAGAIPRLIDMEVKPYLIAPTVQLVIAQRLIRKLCDECKKKIKPNQQVKDLILKIIGELSLDLQAELDVKKDVSIFEQQGCPKCGNTGFSGRIALFEILPITDSIARIIVENPSEANITDEAKKQGMITMQQDGIIKILRGVTTVEEVLRVVEEK